YDAARQRIVLFGGDDPFSGPGIVFGDTWEWDGNNWFQRSPTATPSPRSGHAMAYDAPRSRVVLFGGGSFIVGGGFQDTWEWNGNDWTQMTPVTSPSARAGHAMAFDAARGRVVMFHGNQYTSSEVWEWDGSNWSPGATPPVSPVEPGPGPSAPAMAEDLAHG